MALARGRFELWWLGGFSLAGSLVASIVFAVVLEGEPILALLAIALVGAIVGILLGFGIAQVIVVVADEIELSETRRLPRLSRFIQRLDDLLDEVEP